MIPRECKRLIEVDFPLAKVSYYAAREKSIRHGHPSTLHLWWARRPLASCRAVLLGLLLPDPEDPKCPPEFIKRAMELLRQVPGPARNFSEGLRKALLRFIGEFANWDLSGNSLWLATARGLVQAAHSEETPLVVDPFAGGGSIPLEALRLGCEAFASDLNPVACLILKVLLEDIPRHGAKLAQELREVGTRIKEEAERELAEFYPLDPPDPDTGVRPQPIAYLWARTVKCEAPHCGAEIPLMRSFWLCKKVGRKIALRPLVDRPTGKPPQVSFEIFAPKQDREVSGGTVSRAKARCLACNMVLPPERVRAQLADQRGGADVIFDDKGHRIGGARLLAVVRVKEGQRGRFYRLPKESDYEAVWKARQALARLAAQPLLGGLSPIPDEPTPTGGSGAGRAFSVQRFGMLHWGDLFTARQKVALSSISEKTRNLSKDEGLPQAVKEALLMVIGRCSDYWSSGVVWAQEGEFVAHTFGRQALPIIWDFAEAAPWSKSSGNFAGALEWVALAMEALETLASPGQVQISDACHSPLPDDSCNLWFTDPPYYDAVPYADLSDFFFVWQKRAIPGHSLLTNPYETDNSLTPKFLEIVQDEMKHFEGLPKNRDFFEKRMACAFAEGRRVLQEDGIGSVVFAHKTTEGWEALLTGVLQAGWVITASWPIHTERPGRLRAQDSAALATSIHLVCRPRSPQVGVGDWAEVKTEMEERVRAWMPRLQKEGIRGADALFACIGPAMEVYSRYTQVETPAGHPVPLGGDPEAMEPHRRGFLAYVFEAVSREALRQVLGGADTEGFEEDARLTALFLWTLQVTRLNGNNHKEKEPEEAAEGEEPDEEEDKPPKAKGGLALPFDTFIRITRPMGIHYPDWEQKIIDIEKGVVRLLPVLERQEALFGEELAVKVVELKKGPGQRKLFPDEPPVVPGQRRGAGKALESLTTLDRVHQAMLLYAAGRTTTLKGLLDEESRKGKRFERLAFSLMTLYPTQTPERKWLEGLQAMMKTR
jgi:adenine-specific DNA methylase